MIIVETHIFTRQVILLLSDDEYRLLQSVLANRPDMGLIIPSSGGLRKMRWGIQDAVSAAASVSFIIRQ